MRIDVINQNPLNNLVKILQFYFQSKSFNECLNAKPYKKGSYFIMETYFVELAVKCFAYLPCSNSSSSHDNLWNMDKNRRAGQCHNGFKVTVFDSIEDYSEFMHAKPTLAQKEIIKHALETNVDAFMSDAKKSAKCLSTFPDEHLRIVDMFTRTFLSKSEPAPAPEATTTTTTTTEDNLSDRPSKLDDLKSNFNYVKLFGYELNESLAMILLGSCLLIPAGVIAAYLFVQYVKKRLTRYTSVKLNSNRSEAQLI